MKNTKVTIQRDRIERPKHTKLLDAGKLDNIKDFNPFEDRVDRMILDYVLSERKAVRSQRKQLIMSKI